MAMKTFEADRVHEPDGRRTGSARRTDASDAQPAEPTRPEMRRRRRPWTGVSGTPPPSTTSAPISAPMRDSGADEGDVGDVGRAIRRRPSSLVAAAVSCVRPTSVRMSPRWIVVFGRMGIDGGGGAARDRAGGRRRAPREAAASSASVLPSTALLRDIDVDALDRHVQQLGILDLGRGCCRCTFTSTSRAPATASDIALAAAPCPRSLPRSCRCGGCRSTKTRASGTSALGLEQPAGPRLRPPGCTWKARSSQRCQAEPAPPSSLAAALLLLVVLARDLRLMREQPWTDQRRSRSPSRRCRRCRSPRRRSASSRAGALAWSAGRPSRLMASVDEAHRGGDRLRPRVESRPRSRGRSPRA